MSDTSIESGTYKNPEQIGLSDKDICRRWILELNLAEKDFKDWVTEGKKIYDRYRAKKKRVSSFNILWSNTENLRQSIYNTLPKPDVRRRFRDDDPVAKIVGEVLERCAYYAIDVYDFDHVIKLDLLDSLLPGRGVSRVKYIPDIEEFEVDSSQEMQSEEDEEEKKEIIQKIKSEMVIIEHVSYKDFLHGPGETWDEVRWIAYRHKMSYHTTKEKFGDVADLLDFEEPQDAELKKNSSNVKDLFKTIDVWEVWNKDDKEVLFIAKSFKDKPLLKVDDPLELDGFFPSPRPLYAIEDAETLIPTSLWAEYKEQAEELDRISFRINKLTDALKSRGVYNAVMAEVAQLQDAEDNSLIPVTNVSAMIESGGIEKNIWYMPIKQAADVISVLTQRQEVCKSIIYEITGIADIMRGASNPNETMGAQQIKVQWGSQRLRKQQAEFQRYVRDIIRLKIQVIANKFQAQSYIDMTGLKMFFTESEKQQVMQQAQAFQQYQSQQAANQQH